MTFQSLNRGGTSDQAWVIYHTPGGVLESGMIEGDLSFTPGAEP